MNEKDHVRPQRVGIIGLGVMGNPIATNIQAHHQLSVCDIHRHALDPFADRATVANSAALLGDTCDIVFTCLPSPKACRDVLMGSPGLLGAKRTKIIVNIGTTGPPLAREIGVAFRERGIDVLGAPVSGGPGQAAAGGLTAIVSGSLRAFEIVEPIMRLYASKISYLGSDFGIAQTMKLINNILSTANLAIACEAFVLGRKAGLDSNRMVDVVNNGTGQNTASLSRMPKYIIPREFNYGRRLDHVLNDIEEFLAEAEFLGVETPTSKIVVEIYRRAVAAGAPEDDVMSVIWHMEKAAGVDGKDLIT